MRYDGDTGAGLALRAGLQRISGNLSMGGNVYALLGRKDYQEWGVDGLLRLQPQGNGRGIAFTLAPGIGDTSSKVEQIWQQGLTNTHPRTTTAPHIAPKLNAALSYGFTSRQMGSLWTPYSEMTLADDSQHYRLGMRWQFVEKSGLDLRLKLLGEHRTGGTATTDNAVLLKGELNF